MKDIYIVCAIIDSTVEVDSVWWNEKKADKRKKEIDAESDGAGIVIKKWVNPTIVLSANEYTRKRVQKRKLNDFPMIVCK
jgi:hypothetical protein